MAGREDGVPDKEHCLGKGYYFEFFIGGEVSFALRLEVVVSSRSLLRPHWGLIDELGRGTRALA